MKNLFEQIPRSSPQETFSLLLAKQNFRLERIVSTGQATPPGEWLCQDQDEWVVVLQGRAALQMKSEPSPQILGPGDFLNIPAQTLHRVEGTDTKNPTVWLALHSSP